ncbi:MAG: hypothetical protein FWD78_02405 [Treponema sp.]|nr:hypothetical protein [Treponema sp.]
MKKTNKPKSPVFLAVLITLLAVTGLLMAGCGTFIGFFSSDTITIRSDNNLSTVLAGGTIKLRSSSPDVYWTVSSTSDGRGPLTAGTYIDANGLLTVSPYETASVIYIIARSQRTEATGIRQIRVVTVAGINIVPKNISLARGRSLQFSAEAYGNNNPDNAVTWKVSSNFTGTGAVTSGTSIDGSGLLRVAVNESVTTLYVFATSLLDPSKSDSAQVIVVVPVVTSVTVNSPSQSVWGGSSVQLSAAVTGVNDPDTSVSWRVSSNAAGTGAVTPGTGINANGMLTVAANESVSVLYVIATSAYDTSKSGIVMLNVVIPTVTGVAVSPAGQTVSAGSTFQFGAAISGTNNPPNTVTWKVSSNAAGTGTVTAGTAINANGLLTVSVNETATVLYVFAVSTFDASKSGSVSVNIAKITPPVARPTPSPAPAPAPNPGPQPPSRPAPQPAPQPNPQPQPAPNPRPQPPAPQPAPQPAPPPSPAVTGVTVNPANPSVTAGAALQFSAAVTGTNNPAGTVTWKVSSNAAGTGSVTGGTSISANGLLTVSANETLASVYVFAVSTADTSKSGSTAVTIVKAAQPPARPAPAPNPAPTPVPAPAPAPQPNPAPAPQPNPGPQTPSRPAPSPAPTPGITGVTISPASASMKTNETMQFRAAVAGSNNSNNAVTWKVSSNPAGTGSMAPGTNISANGLLTVAPNEFSTTLYVTATSAADTSKSATAAVTITNNNQNQGSNQGQAQGRN